MVRTSLHERAFQLHQDFQYPLNPLQAMEYEKLDMIQMEGIRYLERQYRKLETEIVDWCPQVNHALQMIRYWKLVQK